MRHVLLIGVIFTCAARPSDVPSRRMADGKLWTVSNLDLESALSYCYGDDPANCARYGRLYTWEGAGRACSALGEGWRLPAREEWRTLAGKYGGVSADSRDHGKAAYLALLEGGAPGFDAKLGGGRAPDAAYARIDAHGFYWTATGIDRDHAWFFNFAKGSQGLHEQDGGKKSRAFSVRCVKD